MLRRLPVAIGFLVVLAVLCDIFFVHLSDAPKSRHSVGPCFVRPPIKQPPDRERALPSQPESHAAKAPCSTASLSPSPSKRPVWLIVGVPTVRRSRGDYLAATLQALEREIVSDPADPLQGQVVVYVMNNNRPANEHFSFFAERDRLVNNGAFVFLENPKVLADADPQARDEGGQDSPSWRVRKQTRDIVALISAAQNRSRYFLFMEDDFVACPRALRAVHYVTNKAYTVDPNWLSIKVSFGMNGFLLKNDIDLTTFGFYLLEHQARRPPDHLSTEWAAAETRQAAEYVGRRPHMTFRCNLFKHIGRLSALREKEQIDYAPCFHRMNASVVFWVDAFEFDRCGHDDIWPCHPPDAVAFKNNPPMFLCD